MSNTKRKRNENETKHCNLIETEIFYNSDFLFIDRSTLLNYNMFIIKW